MLVYTNFEIPRRTQSQTILIMLKNGNIGNNCWMPVFLDHRVQGSCCHGVELTPSLLQKDNNALYMCSYCYKELKASRMLRIQDVSAMYVAKVD